MSKRGFAGMDPAKQKEIASKGGKAAHVKGTAHEFTPETARAAGRLGGHASHANKKREKMEIFTPPVPHPPVSTGKGARPLDNEIRNRFPDTETA